MATTLRYKLLQGIFRATGYRNNMLKDVVKGEQRNTLPKGKQATRWERSEFEGRAVWTCHPKTGATDRAYVHQHGGGFVYGIAPIHYMSLSEIADHAGMTVIMPDYPLPPQTHAPAIIDWADRHFTAVVDHYGLDNVSLGGCSAGGNMTLALLQRRIKRGDGNPTIITLWSPWVDLTPADSPPTKESDTEALITPFGLEPAVNTYLGDSKMDRADPLISPLFADLSDMPTLNIVTGEQDILYPSICEFADKAKAAGKLGQFITEPDYGHYWMFYPVPDRHRTLKQIAGMLA